jgi:hypothetical protein
MWSNDPRGNGEKTMTKAAEREAEREAAERMARATRRANENASTESMIGGLLGGVGQLAASTLIRTQLERIADAMELDTLMESNLSEGPDPRTHPIQERLVQARRFLRDKILARVEREKAAEAARVLSEKAAADEAARARGQ